MEPFKSARLNRRDGYLCIISIVRGSLGALSRPPRSAIELMVPTPPQACAAAWYAQALPLPLAHQHQSEKEEEEEEEEEVVVA
jgi:hypothetical protein